MREIPLFILFMAFFAAGIIFGFILRSLRRHNENIGTLVLYYSKEEKRNLIYVEINSHDQFDSLENGQMVEMDVRRIS